MESKESGRAGSTDHQQFNHPGTTSTGAPAASKFQYDGSIKGPHALKATLTSIAPTTTLTTPSTPRIELSRASSSSHHEGDSRESSPENVFEQVGTGTLQEPIGLGFREEGALELRSSTEELYFMDPEQKREEQERLQQRQTKRSSPHIFKFDDHQTSYLQQHQRKDSASSEVAALLCISGRTSRISSVGSQGSAVSRLSAVSGVSRSPSPHRMLLETSFCGPKPLANAADGAIAAEPPVTAELMEQLLLARKHDPTQAVLASGINVDNFTKDDAPITTTTAAAAAAAAASLSNGNTKATERQARSNPKIGAQRRSTKSPGQMVVGKTAGGTEYIRINLKPDHMYEDKGIAPNERVVEAPNTLAPIYAKGQKKPGSLSLGRNVADDKCRLTPTTSSPQPSRHASRSPSPANNASRKSSFSSLFKFGSGGGSSSGVGGGKDSPDRERTSSRSKSRERSQAPQSQNVTPSKQKTVLAIFRTGKRGSGAAADGKPSKSSSPVKDVGERQPTQSRSKSQTPVSMPGSESRPASRLRYYDEPVEGVIHIPLHTPPGEREAQTVLQGIQQLNVEPARFQPAAVPSITASQLAAAAAALKPISGARKDSANGDAITNYVNDADAITVAEAPPSKGEKLQRIEHVDMPTAHDNKEKAAAARGSEAQRRAQALSEAAVAAVVSGALSAVKCGERAQPANGVAAEVEIHRLPSLEDAPPPAPIAALPEDAAARERRRLLFATRLGSGSQEQIFSTQFSISKTESLCSQLSEQVQDSADGASAEYLHRQDTVIRRVEEDAAIIATALPSKDGVTVKCVTSAQRKTTTTLRQKSLSTSEDEKPAVPTTTVATVMLRRKSRSTSEEDGDVGGNGMASTQRHSRYLEKFDVRKKYHENVPRKPKRQSVSEAQSADADDAATIGSERAAALPHPPPPSTTPSPTAVDDGRPSTHSPIEQRPKTPAKPPRTSTPTRRGQPGTPPSPLSAAAPAAFTPVARSQHKPPIHAVHSTDEPVESSESERDSDLAGSVGGSSSAAIDPKRRHLPRHLGIIEDHESTGLVSQESFEDELPYVPTTLPEERAQGVAILPMRERANMELKTCPVDRPRSTTPLNPSHLEEYCAPECAASELIGPAVVRGEKLRISLPRRDPAKERERAQSSKSPRRTSNASGKSWFEFAEEGLRKDSNKELLPPPPPTTTADDAAKPTKLVAPAVQIAQITPTSSCSTQRKLSGHWIDFENIPEKRKAPKRITTLPRDGPAITMASLTGAGDGNRRTESHHTHEHGGYEHRPDVTVSVANMDNSKIHYNYVKPEDCQCECHEMNRGETAAAANTPSSSAAAGAKLLNSVDLLAQGEDLLPLLDPDMHDGIEPSDSSHEYSCSYTDDDGDVAPARHPSGSSYSRSTSSRVDEFPRRDVRNCKHSKFPDNRN